MIFALLVVSVKADDMGHVFLFYQKVNETWRRIVQSNVPLYWTESCSHVNPKFFSLNRVYYYIFLQINKATFDMVLQSTRHRLEKMNVAGDTIPPAKRLAIGLHRLNRGSYFYDIAEAFGVGQSFDNLIPRTINWQPPIWS